MTNPAPPGGDERPPPVPNVDPLLPVDEAPPPAMPPPPAYETTGRLEPTPAYDALAAEAPLSEPLGEPLDEPLGTGTASTLGPEADYALAPSPTDAGPLGQVKTLAAEKPLVFLGAALGAGWLLGKISSRGKRGKGEDD